MTKLATYLLGLVAVSLTLVGCGKDDPKQQIPHVMTQMTIHVKANPSLKSLRADEATEETISVEECMRRMTDMLLLFRGGIIKPSSIFPRSTKTTQPTRLR